ncbi:MAG: hypothetical protein WC816_04755 [Sphingomonas sp.]
MNRPRDLGPDDLGGRTSGGERHVCQLGEGVEAMRGACSRDIVASGRCVVALVLAALTACAAPSHYAGVDLHPGVVSPDLQSLAVQAQSGSKQAQLELGIRYEEGDGVPQDYARAKRLYRMAASDSGGTLWVYAPSPGGGAPGRVMPVDRGPRVAGLAEARRKLQELQQGRETR